VQIVAPNQATFGEKGDDARAGRWCLLVADRRPPSILVVQHWLNVVVADVNTTEGHPDGARESGEGFPLWRFEAGQS
jgi:hypothetical protein